MKRLWIALGLLLLVITVCVTAFFWQSHALRTLEQELDTLKRAVSEEREDTVKLADAFRDNCIHITEKIATLSRYVDSSPIRESATLLAMCVRRGEYTLFYEQAERCRFYLQEIARNEKPILSNIF